MAGSISGLARHPPDQPLSSFSNFSIALLGTQFFARWVIARLGKGSRRVVR